jgi:GNAT superfamily N-acetyltransferase
MTKQYYICTLKLGHIMKSHNSNVFSHKYIIEDGTAVGELISVWPHSMLLDDNLTLEGVAIASRSIKEDAWRHHFGVELETQTTSEIAQRMRNHVNSRGGRYTFASLDAPNLELLRDESFREWWLVDTMLGLAEHRPILGELGKIARKLRLPISRNFELTRRAYIHNIDVLPDHQRDGIGAAVLDAALRTYPPEAEVVLEAVGPRSYTHAWFERLGLKQNPEVNIEAIRIGETVLEQVRYDSATVSDVLNSLGAKRVE